MSTRPDDLAMKEAIGEDGKPSMFRTMTEEQIKERERLQIANTATSLRRKILEHMVKSNGKVSDH